MKKILRCKKYFVKPLKKVWPSQRADTPISVLTCLHLQTMKVLQNLLNRLTVLVDVLASPNPV